MSVAGVKRPTLWRVAPDEAPQVDDPWEAFIPEDDHEPFPEPGDFWFEDE